MKEQNFDVVIIGGSYSGLSAAMSLGRALRSVWIIDNGQPCNAQTPHSHNFITQDGKTPAQITASAKEQVAQYKTVKFYKGLATSSKKTQSGFEIKTNTNDLFYAKKLVLATGIRDIMPDIKGFAECWGISVIHCPYCHGFEVKNEKTGILGNGEYGFEFSRMVSNWTKDLTLYTNGPSTLTQEQTQKLQEHNISIIETPVDHVEHVNGQIQNIVFKDDSKAFVKAVYAKPKFIQHSDIALQLGCELTEQGLLKVDMFQKTTIPGVFACGDNSVMFRSVSGAVFSGTLAGAMCNKQIIEEEF